MLSYAVLSAEYGFSDTTETVIALLVMGANPEGYQGYARRRGQEGRQIRVVHSSAPRNTVKISQSQVSLLALQGPGHRRAQHRGEADGRGVRDNTTL